jgi:hypothetical protein
MGQQNFANFPVKINPKQGYAVVDSSGSVGYLFEGNKQYQFTIVNAGKQVERTTIAPRLSQNKKDDLHGAALNDSTFTAYLINKKSGLITSIITNRNTGAFRQQTIGQLGRGDQFLRAFPYRGEFYFLTVPSHSNVLKVLKSSDGQRLIETAYPIEMTTFYTALSTNNELLNEEAESDVGIEFIKQGLENNIKSSYSKKKLYCQDDKIIFTFDEAHLTHLVTVDLSSKKAEYKKLNFTLDKGNNSTSKRGNSFVYDNHIFRTTISPQQLNISIVNIDSMALSNTYNIYPEEEIKILNGPMLQEGGTNTMAMDERVIKKTSQYFSKVLNGNIAIAANKLDSGRYQVEVGSYEEFVSRGGSGFGGPTVSFGMGMGMGVGFGSGMGMGFGSPMGSPFGFGSGYYGYPGYYPFNNSYNTRLRIVSFKTLLKEGEFSHAKGELPKTLRQQISDYFEKNFRNSPPELHLITPYRENAVLLGAYSSSKDNFYIVELTK